MKRRVGNLSAFRHDHQHHCVLINRKEIDIFQCVIILRRRQCERGQIRNLRQNRRRMFNGLFEFIDISMQLLRDDPLFFFRQFLLLHQGIYI